MRKSAIQVRYQGLLPDLFREGQGVVAEGVLEASGVFRADTYSPSTTRTTCRAKSPTPCGVKATGRAKESLKTGRDAVTKGEPVVLVEAGHFALALALGLSLIQFVVPLWGARANDPVLMSVAPHRGLAVLACIAFAFFALTSPM